MKHIKSGVAGGWVVLLAARPTKSVLAFKRALEQVFLESLALVSDGLETLAYLRGDDQYSDRLAYPFPNVVVIDCRMPLLSGLSLLCWLRNEPQLRQLPVVLLAKEFSEQQVEMAFRLDAACCRKASTPDEIMEAITRSVRVAVRTDYQSASQLLVGSLD